MTPREVVLYRLIHVHNLPTLLTRGALHSPNFTPPDGLPYRTIHNASVQKERRDRSITCGPGGTCHDYVPFYFGPLSVMLLNLKTGRVDGYDEGQEPLIYLTIPLPRVRAADCRFVFSDGHGLAGFTGWYDNLERLDRVDWELVGARYWADQPHDNDRKRRKQAEFLIWRFVDWSLVERIGVLNRKVEQTVGAILDKFPLRKQPRVEIRGEWYY